MHTLLQKIDELIDAQRFHECLSVLEDTMKLNRNNPDLAWRYARCSYMLVYGVKQKPNSSEVKKLLNTARQVVEDCLPTNPDHVDLLNWYGICIDQVAQLSGLIERVKQARRVREIWDKAEKIDPNHFVTQFCIGTWCFLLADMAPIKRTFIKTFYFDPPTSSYEEALKYLSNSEKLRPRVLIGNLLNLAKTYYRLGDKEKARDHFQYVLQFQDIGNEVAAMKAEATSLMKKL